MTSLSITHNANPLYRHKSRVVPLLLYMGPVGENGTYHRPGEGSNHPEEEHPQRKAGPGAFLCCSSPGHSFWGFKG